MVALLRRSRRGAAASEEALYEDGLFRVDLAGRTTHVDGQTLSLTPLEYRVLCAFVRHPGQILSRSQLLELAWGDAPGAPDEHVKLTVGYLRRKLGAVLEDEAIETVRGFGYRWTRGRVPVEGDGDSSLAISG